MKNTEYKDVFDIGNEALSVDNKFVVPAFPSLKNPFTMGENIRGMSNVSPLATVKLFNQSAEDIQNKYYPDGDTPVEGTFTYIPDNRSDLTSVIKTTVKDFYYYGVKDVKNFAFKVIIFSSTEATKLKECFEISRPRGREILIFVEDNSKDNVSGTYGAMKISEEVLSFLNSKKRLAYDVYDNTEIYKEVRAVVPELTDDQIKGLLTNGYIEDFRINAAKTYFKVASFFSSGISFIHPSLGILTNDALRAATSAVLEEIIVFIEKARLEENRWQPKPARLENGEIDENYKYNPLLSSGKDVSGTVNFTEISRHLKTMLTEQNNFVKLLLNIKKDFKYNDQPKGFLEILYKAYLDAYYIMHNVASNLESISDMKILKYGTKVYNALLCGIWNGLVDAVSGLFAMVKMIYDGITLGKDFAQNIEKYLPTLLEQFDEVIQSIKDIDFTEIAKSIYKKLKEVSLTFDPVACGYFVGYAYGFIISLIIEIIVGTIISGGSLSIAAIANAITELILGIFRLGWALIKGTAKIVRTFAKFVVKTIQDIIKGFQEVISFLRKEGALTKLIEDVFEKLKNVRKNFNQAKWKELQKYLQTRNKFHNMDLVEQLWKQKIETKLLFPNNLKKLYFKYLEEFPALKRGFNQAEFKTTIKKKGKLIEEVEEFSVSGDKDKWLGSFGDPPELPPNTINVLDDWENFEKFVDGAVDFANRPRKYDSEIKYIFNFLKNHMNKGDEFVIETRNIFKTCGSCKREFVMLEDYLRTQGKKVKIIVFSDESIEGTRMLKDKLKIK
ncbi:hypothetical protein [Chryseobacterium shigense]|uniref:Uncharacterized protein n=1 Tax=Chryseobacterium shigense TaxID=297244 RepID=A0A841N2Y1_9FLAO|nr:hypothetical protein [Chryseobacterium shigense]MBB6371506.1 hypothetical protein [Chryseobacterium shigense]